MSLADTQRQAADRLDASPLHIAQQARQTLLELACIAAAPIGSYQPTATKGASSHKPPTTGDPDPPHHRLVRRIAAAVTDTAIEHAVEQARDELAALRRQRPSGEIKAETQAERHARIVRRGSGWGIHEVASALKVSPGDVRKARLAAARDPHTGQAVKGAETAGDSGTACRTLKRQGLTQNQIARQLGLSQPTVSRLLRRAA